MLISLWEACLSLCLPEHVTIFYAHRGGVLWNIAKLWCNFEWMSTIIWVCPTFQSSKCGHTNHLVSVSFIVSAKSAGGNVPVWKRAAARAASSRPLAPRGLGLQPKGRARWNSARVLQSSVRDAGSGDVSSLASSSSARLEAGAVRPASRINHLYNPRTDRTPNSEHQRHRTSQESPGHHGNSHIPPSAEVRIYQENKRLGFSCFPPPFLVYLCSTEQ